MKLLKIGFVGYSSTDFAFSKGKDAVHEKFETLCNKYDKFVVVSGLTNIGIPALVYSEAIFRGLKTVGFSAKEAKEYDCFPVDEEILIGNNFGDESDEFINYIDVLVRIGGGKQSRKEELAAREKGMPVLSCEID